MAQRTRLAIVALAAAPLWWGCTGRATLALGTELSSTQTQRADDSLVVSRPFYDAIDEFSDGA